KPLIFVGDGAKMCYNMFLEEGATALLAPEHLVLQSAWGVARAAETKEPVKPELLKPVYLRLSQAEREKLEKEGRSNG
ncbi:MAG: tRNA (adenosine(37)-N6)-threonylcarbamoyltransferase complex dimerization subunit type 1 TsaB, partial [Oscillospiraceae bacterium]|nr:tRNA (adenosine(37)-N6)-threonylcarbamoyltransferase complex dimerization subunit type 1 TsaB [Oscillospiraceae bacterium]